MSSTTKIVMLLPLLLVPIVLNNAFAEEFNIAIVKGAAFPENIKHYDPAYVRVNPGATVVWTNDDKSVHTVTSGSPGAKDSGRLFDSGFIRTGATFSHTFDEEGIFDYHCWIHPWVIGRVAVSSGAGSIGKIAVTEGDRFRVELIALPPIIEAGKPTSFVLSFLNPVTRDTERNVVYDFAVMKGDQIIVDRKQVNAWTGITTEEVVLEREHSGTLTVQLSNIHFATEPPDPTKDKISFTIDVAPAPEPKPKGEPLPVMTQQTLGKKFFIEMVFAPTVIEPDKSQTFALSFFNAETGVVERNLLYDFTIVKDGQVLVNRESRSAPSGTAVEDFTFNEDQTGSVTVKVSNVRVFPDPGRTAEEAEFSVNVVPEFPLGIMLIATSAIAAMVLFGRFKKLPHL